MFTSVSAHDLCRQVTNRLSVERPPACPWRCEQKPLNCWVQVRAASNDVTAAHGSSDHIINGYAPASSTRSQLLFDVGGVQENLNDVPFSEMKRDTQCNLNAALSAMDVYVLTQQTQARPLTRNRSEKAGVTAPSLAEGRLVDSRFVYRQAFVIRSYEVRFDKTASIETITNLFQETALNHVGMMDFAGDGMGTTHSMMKSCLIWIVTKLHIEVDRYPVWGDIVEIDSWVNASGKNGMKRDFMVRDYRSGCILARGTSNWAMMNKETRRLAKMPDSVRAEISPFFLDRSVMKDLDCNNGRIPAIESSVPYAKHGLLPKLQDLDMNQHVNHVKYIDWVLECVPTSVLVSCDLKSITLEYRRECGPMDMVESLLDLKSLKLSCSDSMESVTVHEGTHFLRLQYCGTEVLRARTQWRPKAYSQQYHNSIVDAISCTP